MKETPRKIIYLLWLFAGCLGLILIILARVKQPSAEPALQTQQTPGEAAPETRSETPQPASSPSGFIAGVTLTKNASADLKKPVDPTTTFSSDAVFHAVVAIKNASANTQFTATWYAVDVGQAAPPSSRIDSNNLISSGTRALDFRLTPNSKWPVGTYRVDIAVNRNLERSITFSVR